jgi:BCD family chlorophyll transporter-like MFS transporter
MKIALRILNNLRLAFFPIAYGLSGALIGGTLNRIMIVELALPATLIAILFAVPLLVSPARIWLGYRSDGFPILGRRREPYILLGGVLIGLGILSAVQVAVNTQGISTILLVGGFGAFLLYGIGRNLSHNTYQALVSDRFSGPARTQAVTLYEVATLVGAVMGAGFLGRALEVYEAPRLVSLSVTVAVVVVALAVFAAIGQEPKTAVVQTAAEKARQTPFTQVFKEVVWSDPQVRLFFILVLFTFVGTLAQDVLLEPYGALVLNMQVGDTSRLTQFWGVGILISMLLSGLLLLRLLGSLRLMRIGLVVSAFSFLGLILVGASQNVGAFRSLVLVMGLGTGLAGAGMLSGVISFTTPIRAGMLIGVWGVANQVGHAVGSIMGGTTVDIVRSISGGNAFLAYSTVFGLEIVMLMVALGLSFRLNIEASRARQEERQQLAPEAAV